MAETEDEMVARFRHEYPDLTEAEECQIRDYASGRSSCLIFRCTVGVDGGHGITVASGPR